MADVAASEDRKGLPVVAYLVFGVSALVILAVGGVLLVTMSIATRNTFELLEDKGRLLITGITRELRLFLEPAEAQVEAIARLIETGRLDPSDRERLFQALEAALAASPHVRALVYFDPSGWLMAARQVGGVPTPEVADWRQEPAGRQAIEQALARHERGLFWGAPVYVNSQRATLVNLQRTVLIDGKVRGVLVSTISMQALSEFITSVETEYGQNAFILYDRDFVLAHSMLALNFPGLGPKRPLPRVTEIGDPVLFGIWHHGWQNRRLEGAVPGHWNRLGNTRYLFLYQSLAPPLDPRWLVGSYFSLQAVDVQLERLLLAGGLGLAGLVVAALVAVWLGRRVSRPIVQLAAAANAIRSLDLDDLAPLRRSRLREIDQAAIAFNAMLRALRVFALYVPKPIVQSLISRGAEVSLASQHREVTVLFTDIVDFTERTAGLGAEQTAEFLNHHLRLVTGCVEAEAGMVDKFIGDAVMALWNAIDEQPDHATRAARAAVAIAAAIRQDNFGRAQPIRVRIGLHSGPVVVGNIGTATRMNYTVVGDTVNLAQRLEALAKEILPATEVAILLSAATARTLPPDLCLTSLGWHRLRGHDAPTEIFALRVAAEAGTPFV
jgi:adenylate cyclase